MGDCYPYGSRVKPKETREAEKRIINHSPKQRTFKITPHGHQGAKILSKPNSSILKSRTEEAVKVKIQAPKEPMIYLITADTDSEGMHLREWLETIIEVK